ncbi:MAG: hypothetical protein IKA11_00820 [Clostridia bacterium]|nr:hypothetical protein [Clostridia bacterium]
MVVLYVFLALISLTIIVAVGILCGRICVELIRDRNDNMNEVLWFWLGFAFNIWAIILTLVVKNRKE